MTASSATHAERDVSSPSDAAIATPTHRSARSPACAPSSPGRAATGGSTRCCRSDDAAGAIAALSPNEVFELVHEVGFEDAQPLIELATPAQIHGCFDLDGWNKDELEVAPLQAVAVALIEAGFEKVGEVWGAARHRAARADPAAPGQDLRHHARRGARRGQRRADHDDARSLLHARAARRRRHASG